MKLRVDIDCSPQELRTFLGLPDVGPLQAEMLEAMRKRLEKGLGPEDLDAMMRAWMGGASAGFEQFQKAVMAGFAKGPQER